MKKNDMFVDLKALHAEVTGSLFLCTARFTNENTLKFIIDCGLFQEEKYDKLIMDIGKSFREQIKG